MHDATRMQMPPRGWRGPGLNAWRSASCTRHLARLLLARGGTWSSRDAVISQAGRGAADRRLSKLGSQAPARPQCAPSWFAIVLVPGILISSQLLNSLLQEKITERSQFHTQ